MVFEQSAFFLLLVNIVIKSSIVSLIYLALVTNFIRSSSKQQAMRVMVYTVGTLLFI